MLTQQPSLGELVLTWDGLAGLAVYPLVDGFGEADTARRLALHVRRVSGLLASEGSRRPHRSYLP